MTTRRLTRLEQVGIVAGIVVIGLFIYLKHFHSDASRRHRRVETEWVKLSSSVDCLRSEAETGRVRRSISKLRKRMDKAQQDLDKSELCLAEDAQIDTIANKIVATAAEIGLMIKGFSQITDKKAIEAVTNGEDVYRFRYYRVTLKGGFGSLRAFLEKINNFPKLIALRSITIEKPEDEDLLRAELWLSM
jgi:Tfp pilus assembly protein PilO